VKRDTMILLAMFVGIVGGLALFGRRRLRRQASRNRMELEADVLLGEQAVGVEQNEMVDAGATIGEAA
jgi:hypothetical protein